MYANATIETPTETTSVPTGTSNPLIPFAAERYCSSCLGFLSDQRFVREHRATFRQQREADAKAREKEQEKGFADDQRERQSLLDEMQDGRLR